MDQILKYVSDKNKKWVSSLSYQDIGSLLYYGQLAIFRESISAVKGMKKEDFEYVPTDAKASYGYYV